MERTALVSKEFHLGPRFSDPPSFSTSYIHGAVGRATCDLRAPQCWETIQGWGAPWISDVWGIPSSSTLAVYQRASLPQSLLQCPSVHTGHPGLVWVPVGFVVHHGQLGLQRLTSPVAISEWTKLQPSFHPLCISLGVFSLFNHVPIIKNWISHLEQIAQRGLRTSSCFLNLTPDACGRVGLVAPKRACPLREKGSTLLYIYVCVCVCIYIYIYWSMLCLCCCMGFSQDGLLTAVASLVSEHRL